MKRRDFVRHTILAGAALQFPHIWIKKGWAETNQKRITILQTNDTHSRIEPFPMDGGRNEGLGGIARRATLVRKFRQQNPLSLLLDAGDSFQGTPYFNLFNGKVEFETMSQCGYDASTLGNHEFDNGVDSLCKAMNYAKFDMVNCNYNFSDTKLHKEVKSLLTRQLGQIKVGITGVGIDFTDLVAADNHKGVSYDEPYKPVKSVVKYLRKNLGCSLVIVLSHLGNEYSDEKPDDHKLAYQVDGIDWIVGGHTHTFMDEPEVIVSKGGYTTRILQVGWAGILLGKTDFIFEGRNLASVESKTIDVDSRIKDVHNMSLSLG